MSLLIDVGNSFIKTMQYNDGHLCSFKRFKHDEQAELLTLINSQDLVLYASVVDDISKSIEQFAQQFSIKVQKISTADQVPLLCNGYENPKQLGVDRWLAMLGARYLFPDNHCIVVDSGTATTIDVITNKGAHLGGWIIPGIELLLDALNSKTAKISVSKKPINNITFGHDTATNVNVGVWACTVGCIVQAVKHCTENNVQIDRVICTGGNGETVKELLTQASEYIPELVFWGMVTYLPSS
jgi:type III pantothenate kinase